MWDDVAALLARRFTVTRYDHRGHGRSAPANIPCTMDDLAGDAARVIRGLGNEPVHFVGVSLGGVVAQRLAVLEPALVSSIVAANATCRYSETSRGMWRARIETVRNRGMGELADGVLERWFSPAWRADPSKAAPLAKYKTLFAGNDPISYAHVCQALAAIEFGGDNPRIACPALVVAGSHDTATPPEMAQEICNTISGAELVMLDTAHLSAVEAPAAFAQLVGDFVDRL